MNKNKRLSLIVLILSVCFVFYGCSRDEKAIDSDKKKTKEEKETFTTSKEMEAEGEQLFKAHCISCNESGAKGSIGPNLTDDYWIHGASSEQIFNVVKDGIVKKGMIAFHGQLTKSEILSIVSYIESLKWTNVKGKDPQGFLYKKKGDEYIKDESVPPAIAEVKISKDIPVIPSNGNAKKGQEMFNISLGCAHCHGQNVMGHTDNRNIKGMKERYGKNWLRVVDYVITKGRAGTAMPSWGHLDKSQLKDLKAFVISLQTETKMQ